MRPNFCGFELGVLLVLSGSIAFAQTPPAPAANHSPPPTATAPAAPSSSTVPADDPAKIEEARALFWQAHAYFEKAEYVEALRLFEQTYKLTPEPEVLFNLALTHQRLGQCEQARTLYNEYQTRVESGSSSADVTKQLAEFEQQCPTPAPEPPAELVRAPLAITVVQPPPEPVTAPPPAHPPVPDAGTQKPFPYKTVGWVAVGAAAVAAGVAVYFEAVRREKHAKFVDKSADPDATGDELDDIEGEFYRARNTAVAMTVVSGVLAAGGVTLLVIAPSAPAQAEAEPLRELGLGLRWSGSF